MPDTFPPQPPTVANGAVTIETWLQNPARVLRTLTDLTNERFISDYIFSPGPTATGGAVIYDQVLGSDLYMDRDVKAIEPGSEFPILTGGELSPLVARAIKWGGAALLTYEERDRDRRDQLARKLTRLRNTLIRRVDTVSIATLKAAPIRTATASASWSLGTTRIDKDVAVARSLVEDADLGYEIDTALISPTTLVNMVTNDKLMALLPRENQGAANPVISGQLTGVAGITRWIKSNRVGNDEVILLSGRQAGSISDEKALYSRVVDQPEKERLLIMAGRLTVPYVTDPKSVVRLTGVA